MARSAVSNAWACLLLLVLQCLHIQAQVFNCQGGLLSIVAHPDDDLLFQSPDLIGPVQSGSCVTHVFLTSGDAGLGNDYPESREAGNEASYAYMAGVTDSWTEYNATFAGQPVLIRTLTGQPNIQRVWFRLPDGGVDGSGFWRSNGESLLKLYYGSISTISDRYGLATYTLSDLVTALGQIMVALQPTSIHTLDYLSDYGTGDHSDHQTIARIVAAIPGALGLGAPVSGYMAYPASVNYAPNLDAGQIQAKSIAFYAYTPYDSNICQSQDQCEAWGRPEVDWLKRQYIVSATNAIQVTVPSVAVNTTPTSAGPVPTDRQNIAPLAIASASSSASGQGPEKAIDTVIDGYPGDAYKEWASNGKAGTTFTLTWSKAYTIDTIVLYDRPNANDQIWESMVDLSDGTEVILGALYNDGSATVFTFDPTSTTSLQLTITAVSPTSAGIGLSEIMVFGELTEGADGADSTPSNGLNIAPLANIVASSSSDVQPAQRAIDGVISGYPANYSAEWASNGEQDGASLSLTWGQSYTVCSVVLFDRINENDQVTSGTLEWSDGSTTDVGELNNDGSATTVSFDPIDMDSLVFTVRTVSDSTQGVGLAELQVFTCDDESAPSILPNSSVIIDSTNNIAPLAIATASSSSDVQPAGRANDGVISGYPANYSAEWASNNQGVGATLVLTWDRVYTIGQVVLYDRPNTNDHITAGTLTFDDGTTVPVGALDNAGGATVVNFNPVTTSTLTFEVTRDTESTVSAGLAEIQVYQALLASGSVSAAVPGPTSGSAIGNIAPIALVTASSQSSGQEGDSATDGVAGGWPGDYTQEWATAGEGAGATLNLTWSEPYLISSIILYDRPNMNDNVLSGSITFSDGTSVPVGQLSNIGTATPISMQPVIASSLLFRIASVSGSTGNIGLSEIEVFGVRASSASIGISSGSSSGVSSALGSGVSSAFSSGSMSASAMPSASFILSGLSSGIPSGSARLSSAMPSASGMLSASASGRLSSAIPSYSASGALSSGRLSASASSASGLLSSALSSLSGSRSQSASAFVPTSLVSGSISGSQIASATQSAQPVYSTEVVNVAPRAMVIVSSQTSSNPGARAVDGVISATNSSASWITNSQGAGANILLTWSSPVVITRISLYDRGSLLNRISSGTLTFSDGSSLSTGALPSGTTPLTGSFAAKTVTWVRFTVRTVTFTTSAAGLNEFSVFGYQLPAVAASSSAMYSPSATISGRYSSVVSSQASSVLSSVKSASASSSVQSSAVSSRAVSSSASGYGSVSFGSSAMMNSIGGMTASFNSSSAASTASSSSMRPSSSAMSSLPAPSVIASSASSASSRSTSASVLPSIASSSAVPSFSSSSMMSSSSRAVSASSSDRSSTSVQSSSLIVSSTQVSSSSSVRSSSSSSQASSSSITPSSSSQSPSSSSKQSSSTQTSSTQSSSSPSSSSKSSSSSSSSSSTQTSSSKASSSSSSSTSQSSSSSSKTTSSTPTPSASPVSKNIAGSATVSVSQSQANGFRAGITWESETAPWVTSSVGNWIELRFSGGFQTVTRIELTAAGTAGVDQISGTLYTQSSSGAVSQQNVGSVTPGSPTVIYLNQNTGGLRFLVNSVSPTTKTIGLKAIVAMT